MAHHQSTHPDHLHDEPPFHPQDQQRHPQRSPRRRRIHDVVPPRTIVTSRKEYEYTTTCTSMSGTPTNDNNHNHGRGRYDSHTSVSSHNHNGQTSIMTYHNNHRHRSNRFHHFHNHDHGASRQYDSHPFQNRNRHQERTGRWDSGTPPSREIGVEDGTASHSSLLSLPTTTCPSRMGATVHTFESNRYRINPTTNHSHSYSPDHGHTRNPTPWRREEQEAESSSSWREEAHWSSFRLALLSVARNVTVTVPLARSESHDDISGGDGDGGKEPNTIEGGFHFGTRLPNKEEEEYRDQTRDDGIGIGIGIGNDNWKDSDGGGSGEWNDCHSHQDAWNNRSGVTRTASISCTTKVPSGDRAPDHSLPVVTTNPPPPFPLATQSAATPTPPPLDTVPPPRATVDRSSTPRHAPVHRAETIPEDTDLSFSSSSWSDLDPQVQRQKLGLPVVSERMQSPLESPLLPFRDANRNHYDPIHHCNTASDNHSNSNNNNSNSNSNNNGNNNQHDKRNKDNNSTNTNWNDDKDKDEEYEKIDIRQDNDKLALQSTLSEVKMRLALVQAERDEMEFELLQHQRF